MMSAPVKKNTFWLASTAASTVDCLCFGTGRFLRSVLMPALVQAGFHPALIQTRGRTMLDYMSQRDSPTYEVDTVLPSGKEQTAEVACYGAYSLGTDETKQAVYQELLPNMKTLSILGVGVTEAGLASSSTPVMHNLYELLQHCRMHFTYDGDNKLCIIDMDNVPNNGQVLQNHMMELAKDDETMRQFLETKVALLDTMVDRITSQREGSNGMVPRCEPVPMKALVILDTDGNLPESILKLPNHLGVVVRSTPHQLQADIALKLRVANGTHTAVAHAMALCKILKTDVLLGSSDGDLIMAYLDSLFQSDILNGASVYGTEETLAAYQDWRGRLCHAHFGLSTFFITQNGAAKGGIRLGPTVASLLQDNQVVSVAMACAFAAILKWLTPCQGSATREGVYRGWLEGSSPQWATMSMTQGEEYADGLRHDLDKGWYEFKCACRVDDGTPVSEWLARLIATGPQQPHMYVNAIRAYLTASDGGNLSANLPGLDVLVQAVTTLYARMVVGDGIMNLLEEMRNNEGPYVNGFATGCSSIVDDASLVHGRPLSFRPNPVPACSKLLQCPVSIDLVESVVVSEVASVQVIDLHTHLLPPSHGSLCSWGIDELLTYVSTALLCGVGMRHDSNDPYFPFLTSIIICSYPIALLGGRILYDGPFIDDTGRLLCQKQTGTGRNYLESPLYRSISRVGSLSWSHYHTANFGLARIYTIT